LLANNPDADADANASRFHERHIAANAFSVNLQIWFHGSARAEGTEKSSEIAPAPFGGVQP
jgi:hypothetical protein